MAAQDSGSQELAIGARVCQRCQKPFVLIAKSDPTHLLRHMPAMKAVVEEWGLPAYLVLPSTDDPRRMRVVEIRPGHNPRWVTQDEYAELQEDAYLAHTCPAPPSQQEE